MKRILVALGALIVLGSFAGGARHVHAQPTGFTGPLPASSSVIVQSPERSTTTATIASGESLSGVIDLRHRTLSRIVIPSAWTTANITFQTSYDGVTYSDLYDSSGGEVTVTVGGASREIAIESFSVFVGVRYFKLRSGTTGTPVAQGAARTIGVGLTN